MLNPISDADRPLLAQAACRVPTGELSEQDLRDLMASDGIDLATALLYQHICTSVRHHDFIQRVNLPDPPQPPRQTPLVVIMPGAFHVEYPHTGADGARLLALASQMGWRGDRVQAPSLGSMSENAAALVDLLSRHRGEPIILVSLSKGGLDVRAALARPNATSELQDVRAWVNISGLVFGTPLIAWLRARPLRWLGVRLLLRVRRQQLAHLEELHRSGTKPAGTFPPIPPHLRAIHIVGFPLQRHLSNNWARRGHARLAALGPNDGGGILLHDVTRLPGDVYPVWGADHYLNPSWDINPLLLRLLQEAARDEPTDRA